MSTGKHTAQGLTGRALGEAVIDHVLTFPEQHNQSFVVNDCGTTACLAGWVIAFHYGRASLDHGQQSLYEAAGLPWGMGASQHAAGLLGVDPAGFEFAVFVEHSRDTAISNLKHLLDETYSERAL